jgi:glycine cleavage system H protein
MIPTDIQYTKSHEWARVEGDVATIGVTHFAQEQLGDLTFVELPAVGATLTAGAEMGSVESVKAASELYSPINGTVLEINAELEANPGLVNSAPYGDGWMIKAKLTGPVQGLLSAEEYGREIGA